MVGFEEGTEMEVSGRKEFYTALREAGGLPENWEIYNESIYSKSPTIHRKAEDGTRHILRIGVSEGGEEVVEVSVMYTVEKENATDWEYQLKIGWEFDSPTDAGQGILIDCIPHVEQEMKESYT